jgi:hypothetical protein
MTRQWRPVVVLLLAIALLGGCQTAAEARLPSEKTWLADVSEAMKGSLRYLERRADRGGRRLAVNFDIDNTSIASHYDPGDPVPQVLKFARRARSLGIHLLFNTGRQNKGDLRASTLRQLERNGYEVRKLCMRKSGQTIVESKKRCRRHFVAKRFTIIANVGNRGTDFAGGNYERAFRLPNYNDQLN